jgi:hypothetical protein
MRERGLVAILMVCEQADDKADAVPVIAYHKKRGRHKDKPSPE